MAKSQLNFADSEKATAKYSISHKILRIFCIVFIIAALPLLIINITLFTKNLIHPDEVPSVFGIYPLPVASGSMEDEILVGDLIFSKKVDTKTLNLGDVISFQVESKSVVTHRIIEIIENSDGSRSFRTKGDANTGIDRLAVQESDVLGVVVYRIGTLGDIALFLETPLGIVLCVVMPLLLFIFVWALQTQSASRRREEEMKMQMEALVSNAQTEPEKDSSILKPPFSHLKPAELNPFSSSRPAKNFLENQSFLQKAPVETAQPESKENDTSANKVSAETEILKDKHLHEQPPAEPLQAEPPAEQTVAEQKPEITEGQTISSATAMDEPKSGDSAPSDKEITDTISSLEQLLKEVRSKSGNGNAG